MWAIWTEHEHNYNPVQKDYGRLLVEAPPATSELSDLRPGRTLVGVGSSHGPTSFVLREVFEDREEAELAFDALNDALGYEGGWSQWLAQWRARHAKE